MKTKAAKTHELAQIRHTLTVQASYPNHYTQCYFPVTPLAEKVSMTALSGSALHRLRLSGVL